MSVDAAEERLVPEADRGGARAAVPSAIGWILRFPYSPIWLGVAAGGAYALVAAAAYSAGLFDSLVGESAQDWGLSAEAAYVLWFGWAPIAAVLLVRGVDRDASDLAPLMQAGEKTTGDLRHAALRVPHRFVWGGAGVGLFFTVSMIVGVFGLQGGSAGRGLVTYLVLRELVVELVSLGILGWAVGAAVGLSRLTESRARADLLDPHAFAALSRNGMRLAAVWLVMMAIGFVGLLDPPPAVDAEFMSSFVVMSLGLSGFALLGLFLPTRGARRVLIDAKREELERVRREIAEARGARADERLPGLLAWEGRVDAVSEWPIDAATLRRLGIFVLLPLGSWIGGALVERLVDAALR